MPYIPGTGRIQDVYNSPNVYANNVNIALWLNAAGTEAATMNAIMAMINDPNYEKDKEIQEATEGSDNELAVAQQQKRLVESGVISQADLNKGNGAGASPAQANTGSSAPPGDINTGSVVTINSDIDNTLLYDSPETGIKYYVKTVTKQPGVIFPYDVGTIAPKNGFTVEEVIKNLQLMVINCYDPIKKQFPDAFMTNSFRADLGYAVSPHKSGSACDIQFSRASNADYYTRALWIKDNVKFDQFLLEYKTTGSRKPWLHLGINSKGKWRQQVCTFMNDKNCKGPGVQGLFDLSNVV
jgi:hypothetical protein